MHFLKKGQKNRAWVDPPPPPLIQALPERKRFFPLMSSLSFHSLLSLCLYLAPWTAFLFGWRPSFGWLAGVDKMRGQDVPINSGIATNYQRQGLLVGSSCIHSGSRRRRQGRSPRINIRPNIGNCRPDSAKFLVSAPSLRYL